VGCNLPTFLTLAQVSGRTFTPAVIEPSFGIGRIMYCMFEHSYYARDGGAAPPKEVGAWQWLLLWSHP
jgi:glycyl-tRNA synthetase (class II)